MARITVEDCLKKVPNRFMLAHLAMRRAKQLLKGAKSTVEGRANKPVVMALREVASGSVRFMTDTEQTASQSQPKEDPFQIPAEGFKEGAFDLDFLGEDTPEPNGSSSNGKPNDDDEEF